jgi:hypothetical protein
MATAWRVVADDYSSPYVGRVKGPRWAHPAKPIRMPVGAIVEHDSSDPHPHPPAKRGIWAWREEHIAAAIAINKEIAGSRILELRYDDPADVVAQRRSEIHSTAPILRRCHVIRELDPLEASREVFIVLARRTRRTLTRGSMASVTGAASARTAPRSQPTLPARTGGSLRLSQRCTTPSG